MFDTPPTTPHPPQYVMADHEDSALLILIGLQDCSEKNVWHPPTTPHPPQYVMADHEDSALLILIGLQDCSWKECLTAPPPPPF